MRSGQAARSVSLRPYGWCSVIIDPIRTLLYLTVKSISIRHVGHLLPGGFLARLHLHSNLWRLESENWFAILCSTANLQVRKAQNSCVERERVRRTSRLRRRGTFPPSAHVHPLFRPARPATPSARYRQRSSRARRCALRSHSQASPGHRKALSTSGPLFDNRTTVSHWFPLRR